MRRFPLPTLVLLAVVLSPASAAPTFESLSAEGVLGFDRARALPERPRFVPSVPAQSGDMLPIHRHSVDASQFEQFLKEHSSLATAAEGSATPKGPAVADLDLAALHNRHLKSRLQYLVGGVTVWISGTFDRGQNAFVSVLVDGQTPLFYEVKGLLEKEQTISVGSGRYKLYLAPNLFNKLKSEIVLENTANEDEQVRVTIKKLLDAISAAGDEVKLSDQSYRAFYYDDIKNGRQDPATKTFAFVMTDAAGEFHVFLIPAELVPADQAAVFKMHNNKKIGLQQAGGRLKVFEL